MEAVTPQRAEMLSPLSSVSTQRHQTTENSKFAPSFTVFADCCYLLLLLGNIRDISQQAITHIPLLVNSDSAMIAFACRLIVGENTHCWTAMRGLDGEI